MAISKYIQQCDYRIGGLKPYIYLVHKNAMSINFKAKGVDVNFKKTKDSDVYKINASLCTYEQDETYANKYKFANTLEVSLNEQFREPFLYGLRTLRTNQYYIIIEDKKGVQYLINPELYTVLNYEYTFGDTNDSTNGVTITWTNINNHPLLIMEERIESNLVLLGEECPYNIGSVNSLMMASFNDLKVNDDGVVADKLYVEDYTKIYSIDYLKKSFNLTETYDGNMFRTTMSFSIPLEENQFNWHYNLIEFKDNIYKAVVGTTNENYLILGVEKGLSVKYNITTSEDENNLNLINISFTQLSQYPIVYTNDITQYRWFEDGTMCFGFDKYQMLTQQYSEDWGETWITSDPIEKKKGDIIESDSEECKEYQWIDDGTYCYTTDVEYFEYRETTSYVCENGNKYKKLQKYSSTDDGKSYQAQEEYIKGDLVEEDSEDCNYIAIRWIDTNGYMCYPVNEDLTRWDITGTQCSGTTLYNTTKELVTNNGTTYYESGVNKLGDIVKENCCACGYINTEYRFDETVCSTAITETSFTETRTYDIINVWTVDTFTIKGEGTYTITPDLLNNKYANYIALSHLDTDLKLTATTSTSTATTSNYNRGTYYNGSSKYGTWSFTINDDLEHTFQVGTYLNSTSSSYSGETAVITVTSPKQDYSLYDKYYLWEYCNDEYETVERQTETYKYELKEYHSCECEWTGTTWQWDGKETICGSYIGLTATFITISSDTDRSIPMQTFRIDATVPNNDGNYFITFSSSPNYTGSYASITKFSICPDEGTIYDNGKIKNITAQTKIDDNIYEYTFSVPVYFAGAEVNAPYEQVTYLGETNADSTSEYEVWRETDCNNFTGNVDYRNPKKSCKCDYREYDWEWDGEETICGNVLCGEMPSLTINSVQGNWTREGNTFTSNDINDNERTIERIYFSVSEPTYITFTIDQSSENSWDYLVISNLDKKVVSGHPTSTGSSYNYYNHKNRTTGSTSMTISDTEEHFIELMYRKDGGSSSGRDNVIVTLSIPNSCTYDITSEYEVWREYEYCPNSDGYKQYTGNVDYRNPKKSCECEYRNYDWEWDETWEDAYICGGDVEGLDSIYEYEVWKEYEYCPISDGYKSYTGKVDYRNPKKSYKCDYVTYQWREEEITCGNALPENTTEVNKAPEINKDFE